jgi:hypothetical protein
MTPEQRYQLDAQGWLVIRSALTPQEVAAARASADEYVNASDLARAGGKPLPPGFGGNGADNGKGYGAGFAWAKPLERLVFHRSTWPIVLVSTMPWTRQLLLLQLLLLPPLPLLPLLLPPPPLPLLLPPLLLLLLLLLLLPSH